ncbi:universal stress protein [Stutzerimonas tarimensis]|uniref:Universal stress protein n=1 Tax=Stutzerimonas tarimensis TaxID=1507735 RepID=A0ABV7T3X2_9GAMM
MREVRSILVVMEPDQAHGLALPRASQIASTTGSELHLLVCDKRDSHDQYLKRLADQLRDEGHTVSTRQEWLDKNYQTIIEAQQAEGCGLVIKEHQPETPLKRALLTPDDWKLLRFCPCPVLMVKTASSWSGGNVLAAVDVGNSDAEHLALHSSIVSCGYDLASLSNGALHVLSAHPSAMLSTVDPTYGLKETLEERYRDACRAFQSEYGIGDEQLHIVEGPADAIIPQVASQLQAVVTVIGSVARTGLSGVLMGNTAEVALDALDTDVLVLKPDDIVAHLEELAAHR